MDTRTRPLFGFLLLAVTLFFGGNVAQAHDSNNLVINLKGKGVMYEAMVPDVDGDGYEDPAMCFDVPIFDPRTGKKIGRGTDCLSAVNPGDNGGLALVGTAYFKIRGKGRLITRGTTTVQPVNWPTRQFTHITGGNSADNAVIKGTGRYKNLVGTQRLSGMVDMSNFSGGVGEVIDFDCLFVLDLHRERKRAKEEQL